ncbi:6-deoxyerythronolide B hydroxylase [Methyloligella halotolerans]|uniref:6-deoxyerythronolide B hydroxylase n=1 Tax=Methyloligella halotolerans TaxID=1177755 RepID=A0A1E2RWC4_9HYPH|nr:cytochrome P450 [Methyloligella halotolerans]ODA66425.1 6-deoxyerythronolide B hydroxylase [Methyloligella halotolerans]
MENAVQLEDAPFVDIANPTVSIRGSQVKEARDQSWFARTPYGIAVLRYNEVRKLLLHKGLRQGSHAWPGHNEVQGIFADWWSRSILALEGEDHSRLRKLVNPAFSPRVIQGLLPKFEEIADELTADFIEKGECDFMADFANPYASRVLCHVLGLPKEEAAHVLNLSADMGLALGVDFKKHEARINEATEGMYAYADEIVARRRQQKGGDDFMSNLVAATEDNDRLSDNELRDMILMLVFAGIDTTRNQLGLGISMFLEHPDQWTLLGDNPDLAPKAVEEVLRVRPTITWVTREAWDDFEYEGLMIKKGTTLHMISESAGTDPEVFDPVDFDIANEDRARNFGFGGGIHHCLGHAIARSDMTVAFRKLPQQMRNIRKNGEGHYLPDSGNTGPISLPIAFDPEKVAAAA